MNQIQQATRFRLTTPSPQILATNLAARVDIGSLSDRHIRRRCDKRHGWFAWIVAWDPVGYGDVVRGVAKANRNGAVECEEKLGSSIVEREHLGFGR